MARGLAANRQRWRVLGIPASPALVILATAAVAALLLALPGQTVATRSLDELFYIFDGVHRVLSGHAPGRDFVTALGPLPHYLPALGALLGGWAGAMPVASALAILVLGAVAAHVLSTRFQPFLALLLAGFLLLILSAPINLGEPITALSFAHFHYRIGWGAIALLIVMYLPPHAPVSPLRDAVCAALLTLVTVYTRLTYGTVALLFLLLMLTDTRQRIWAAWALAAVAVTALALELVWGGSLGYVRATLMAAGAGGYLRVSWGQIADHLLTNFADYVLLALIAGLSLARRWRTRDALFFLFVALAGFWLINHNIQRWGIVVLHAAAAVAAERILREDDGQTASPTLLWANPPGAKLFFLAMVLPTVVHCLAALALHAGAAVSGAGRPLPIAEWEGVRLVDLWTGGDFAGGSRYLEVVEDGLAQLSALSPPPERLIVLGGPDPFSPVLGLEPARGAMPELRWLRTFGPSHHLPPERLLANAEVVMERASGAGLGPAAEIYLPEVEERFTLAAESEHWRIHRRTPDSGAR